MSKKKNREVEKPTREQYVVPKTGRIPCKVYNNKFPGDDIVGCVNGATFQIKHGELVELHPAQIHCLQNAVIETEEYNETAPNQWEVRPVVEPRFQVQIMLDQNILAKAKELTPEGEAVDLSTAVHTGRNKKDK